MASMLRLPVIASFSLSFFARLLFLLFPMVAKAFPVPAKVRGALYNKSRKDRPIARLFCLVEARRCRMETARSVNALLYGGTWAALSSQGKPFQSASPPYLPHQVKVPPDGRIFCLEGVYKIDASKAAGITGNSCNQR